MEVGQSSSLNYKIYFYLDSGLKKIEKTGSTKVLITFYQATSCHNIHDCNLKLHRLHDNSLEHGGGAKNLC